MSECIGVRSEHQLVVAAALIAMGLKLLIALSTFGSNDVLLFHIFAAALEKHDLTWTYQHSPLFNHPPLVGYFLRAIGPSRFSLIGNGALDFPFLLRLPGIVADFIVVLALLRAGLIEPRLRLPRWALLLFALSPVSLMVSGFHGNTDSVMVMFLVLAALMLVHDKPLLCGLFLALSCQVKVVPFLVFPILFLVWQRVRRVTSFLLSFGATCVVCWGEPLFKGPMVFFHNVLSYGSFWGIWGITYCLRLTRWQPFAKVSFFGLSTEQNLIALFLKVLIVVTVLWIAWQRRHFGARAALNSIAYAWIVFFALSPGISAQYLVWLAPFVLLWSPVWYAALVASSSIFLAAFYSITSRGFPWYFANSTPQLNTVWTPWALLPWLVLLGAFVVLQRALFFPRGEDSA